jgi:hypothetical protein
VRIHGCRKGMQCAVMQDMPRSKAVFIRPVVCSVKGGRDILELGVGGGYGDLDQKAHLDATFAVMKPLLDR